MRHLGNGWRILNERGTVALTGAAILELAKLVDPKGCDYLQPSLLWRQGPALIRARGLRATAGAVLRHAAVAVDASVEHAKNPVNKESRDSAIRYEFTHALLKPDGVTPSRRPANACDFALIVPFGMKAAPAAKGPVAAIVHVFYPELLQDILRRLHNIPLGVDLFISTDTDQKKARISESLADWSKGRVEIRVLENRGRDIAAKFVGFADVYERYDLFVHLHAKKSPHGGDPLAGWRDYLLETLVGSKEIVESILTLFDDPRVGVVFPQHFFVLRGILNWGYDYELARGLMRRLGVEIDKNLVLEFPSGSMFWGRSAAIKPLLDLKLTYADFPAESGQVDGTLAHAIERIILMVAESAHFEWRKIVKTDQYPLSATMLRTDAPEDIEINRMRVFQPCLANVDDARHPVAVPIDEMRPIPSYPSRSARPRINLLVPTINPRQTFGGVATALRVFRNVSAALGDDWDQRIVVTDALVEPQAYQGYDGYEAVPYGPALDREKRQIVDASERDGGRLNLRAGDVFIASAWWTARHIFDLESDRRRYFGGDLPFIYLIQDDEPYFYGWSTRFSLAESTYRRGARTLAIVNSEELFDDLSARYEFSRAWCLPYKTNEAISQRLAAAPRERLILVYGRPSVHRNLFELTVAALVAWQQRDPIFASRWSIVFLGEEFSETWLEPLQNARVRGKAELEEYAGYLNRALVGLSLMVSPHPSYPPLEMAEAGMFVVANGYGAKDLSSRFDNIVSVRDLDDRSISRAVEDAVRRAEPHVGRELPRRVPRSDGRERPLFSPEAVAEAIRSAKSRALLAHDSSDDAREGRPPMRQG